MDLMERVGYALGLLRLRNDKPGILLFSVIASLLKAGVAISQSSICQELSPRMRLTIYEIRFTIHHLLLLFFC